MKYLSSVRMKNRINGSALVSTSLPLTILNIRSLLLHAYHPTHPIHPSISPSGLNSLKTKQCFIYKVFPSTSTLMKARERVLENIQGKRVGGWEILDDADLRDGIIV